MHLHSIPACHKWLCLPFLPQRITAPPLVATARAAAAPCLCTSAGACSRRVATPHLAATIPPSARAAALMAHQLRSSPSARKEVGARPFCLSLLPLLLRMLVGSAASYPCSSSCHSPPCPPPPYSPAGWDCYDNPCAANPRICQRGSGLGTAGPDTGGPDPLPPDAPSCEEHPQWCRQGEDGTPFYDYCLENPEACVDPCTLPERAKFCSKDGEGNLVYDYCAEFPEACQVRQAAAQPVRLASSSLALVAGWLAVGAAAVALVGGSPSPLPAVRRACCPCAFSPLRRLSSSSDPGCTISLPCPAPPCAVHRLRPLHRKPGALRESEWRAGVQCLPGAE